MKRTINQQSLILTLIVALTATGCVETVTLSRGTRIPPELRGTSSAEVTESLTQHTRGEHVSMAATLIDFSYVRAITNERGRSRDQEREAYQRYVRRQTTFYVNLVLHGRESCRPSGPRRSADDDDDDEGGGDELQLEAWRFRLSSSSGREKRPESIEPGTTQRAPSGGCLVQGYVHFPGNVASRDEWIELEATAGERGRLSSGVRWNIDLYSPPRRQGGSDRPRPRPRPRPPVDDSPESSDEGAEESSDEGAEESSDEGAEESSDEGAEEESADEHRVTFGGDVSDAPEADEEPAESSPNQE